MHLENLSSQRDPLTLKATGIEHLTPEELLAVFRSRYRMYSQRDLINQHERQSFTCTESLRNALLTEQTELPEIFDPKDYQIDCDAYDFDSSCRHVLIQSGHRLIAYFRIIHESGGPRLPLRELYEAEYLDFRARQPGAQVAELSRLILDVPQSRMLSAFTQADELKLGLRVALRLFQVMCQYAKKHDLTDIFAQTHPSHASMYVRHLFKIIGEEKNYKSVNNHPAVLLHYHVK